MKAKLVEDKQHFERHQDNPIRSLGIGVQERVDMGKGMRLFSIWLNNFNPNFIEKVWEGSMAEHFRSKWNGAMSKSKYDYADPTSIMKFVNELSSGNQTKLFDYISSEYKDQW